MNDKAYWEARYREGGGTDGECTNTMGFGRAWNPRWFIDPIKIYVIAPWTTTRKEHAFMSSLAE